jgi:hypothetical protein
MIFDNHSKLAVKIYKHLNELKCDSHEMFL